MTCSRDQGVEQPVGRLRDLLDGAVEGLLVEPRRLVEAAQLADELQRSGADLLVGGALGSA